jgi:hypothetical protein
MCSSVRKVGLALIMVAAGGSPAWPSVLVRPDPLEVVAAPGELFEIRILADIPEPVVGWGLDLGYDSGVLSLAMAPVVGPLWVEVLAPDGDGLAGYAFPSSISGQSILLATLVFWAEQAGETDLIVSVTPGDLTEGFPLDPSGFADAVFEPGHVAVVPEPVPIALAGLGWAVLSAHARRRNNA